MTGVRRSAPPRTRFIPSILRRHSPPETMTILEMIAPRVVFPGGSGESLLPTDDVNPCSICLSTLDKTMRITTPCDHTFHVGCFNRIINNSCPLCRTELC